MTRKILEDSFTDTNGTLLSAHVGEVGADWSTVTISTSASAEYEIINNEVSLTGNFSSGQRFVEIQKLPSPAFNVFPYAFDLTLVARSGLEVGKTHFMKLFTLGVATPWLEITLTVDAMGDYNANFQLGNGPSVNVGIFLDVPFDVSIIHTTVTDMSVRVDAIDIASITGSSFGGDSPFFRQAITIVEASFPSSTDVAASMLNFSVTGSSVYLQDTFTDTDGTRFIDHVGEINTNWGGVSNASTPDDDAFLILNDEATTDGPDTANARTLWVDSELKSPPVPVEYVFNVRADALPSSAIFFEFVRQDDAAVIAKVAASTNGGSVRWTGSAQAVLSGFLDVTPGASVEIIIRFTTATDAEIFIGGVSKGTTAVATYPTGQALEFRMEETVSPGGASPNPVAVLENLAVRAPVTDPPLLLSINPPDGSVVPANTSFVLTFSEDVFPGFGSIDLIDTNTGGGTLVFDINDASQVVFLGATITITPLAELKAATIFNGTASADAIVDVDGEPFIGIPKYVVSTNAWFNFVGTKEI